MTIEQEWLDGKAEAKADLEVALSIGLPLEMAKRLARWNHTYEFDTFNDMQTIGDAASNYGKDSITILVTRSPSRVNVNGLESAVLDASTLYAIFIPDIPEMNILDISFSLNGVPVHHEFAAPWDYEGTLGDGTASRVTFVAGHYEIEAILNASGGPFSVTASFDVE